jgi:hypothetical protein
VVALVCPVDLEEAGLVRNGADQVPTMALASIFVNTDQSQHTLTAIFSGHHHCRRVANAAYDGAVAGGRQYELSLIV